MSTKISSQIKVTFLYFINILSFIFGKDGLRARHRRFAICGLFIIISSIVFLNFIFPNFLESLIQQETALRKGSFMRNMWKKLPIPYEFRAYVFNVTNPEDINQGMKPIVREVGPYVYDVWQNKTQLEDHETDDTLTYSVKNTYFFNQAKSKCLTEEDELMFSNFFMLGVPISLVITKPGLLPVAAKAIDAVMNKPQSAFVKSKVKTILFDGYLVDCAGVQDFLGKAFCDKLKETWFTHRIRKFGDNIYSASLFGQLNDTDVYSGQTRIRRGMRDIKEIGDLIEHNHMKYLSIWEDDECDMLRGTDGTFFHPFVDKHKSLYVTDTSYCRTLEYRYESSVKFAGLKLFRYTANLGVDPETNPKDKCYCLSSDKCTKDGVYDVWKCLHSPLIMSNPHFYLADSYYINAVEGVKPVKKKHMIILDIDPLTGWPVRAYFRFQYNYKLGKLEKYRLMKNFPEALLPLAWVDQVMVSPNNLLDRIVHLYKVISLARSATGLAILFGLILGSVTAFHEYRLHRTRLVQKKIMKKYASKWKALAEKQDKRKMGISLRTIKTLKLMQRNQIAAAEGNKY